MEPGENRAGAAFLMGVPLQNQNEKDFFASPGSFGCLRGDASVLDAGL
jgi:hypothetical protein